MLSKKYDASIVGLYILDVLGRPVSKIPDGTKTVVFGATVQVSDLDNNTKIKFQIVGDDEADIEQGLLSYKSPVAKSLISKEKGDFATAITPKGEKNYEIIKITYE